MSTHHPPPRPQNPCPEPGPASGRPVLYTPAEAARLLRVRESWLRKRAAARLVPCTFLGKHLRFSPTDLAAIVTAAARPAGARKPRRRTTSTTRTRDLPIRAESSVDASRHRTICDGSSRTWPG